jgi:lipopolysaccharide/colanic/teichoic acid biosynthesis glycosyltransferase
MDGWTKRTLDIVLAAAAIVVTAPLWAVIALVIRLSSRGGVFYKGLRVGKDGRLFSMYKFRTMRHDAQRLGPRITARDDPRITRVGRILRRTKLDELPQFLNVLRGEMSLVGPRPEVPEYVALYDERQRQVLSVRPGITGPTQLIYRDEEQLLSHAHAEDRYSMELLPRKLEMDLQYVQTQSFSWDLWLLLATIGRLPRRSRQSELAWSGRRPRNTG